MVDHADDTRVPQAERQDEEAAAALGGERVAKALARAGVASRRDVERYIAAGRVALNGKVLDTPAVKVEPGDVLTVDGAVVGGPEATRVWRHHKPAGLITSHGDPSGRPTVFEHLPGDLPRVISIGRLDLATEGLLLLTNDGELARKLELPDNGWRRVYRARAHGRADQARLDTLRDGATIEGVRYGPVEARLDKATGKGAVGRGRVSDAPANLWITVTVAEGKNREVRRVLEHLGLKVNRLIRLAYGPFALGELLPGEVEEIAPRVLREQLEGLVALGSLPKGNRRPGPPTRGSPPSQAASPARAATPTSPRPQGRSVRPQGAQPPRGREETRGGKPPPRAKGAVGRVSGAWSPPGERPGGPSGAAGGKFERGRATSGEARRGKPAFGGRAVADGDVRPPRQGPSRAAEAPTARGQSRPGGAARPVRAGGESRERAEPRGGLKAGAGAPPGRGRPGDHGPAAPSRDRTAAGGLKGKPPHAGASGRPPSSRGQGGGGKAAAAGRDAERPTTGLELAPPMRRGPRRKPGAKGPRRPPRED